MIAVDITLKGGLCNKLFQLFSACDIAIKDKTKILEPSFGWERPILFSDIYDIDFFNNMMKEFNDDEDLMVPHESRSEYKIIQNDRDLWRYSEKILRAQRNSDQIKRNSMMVIVMTALRLNERNLNLCDEISDIQERCAMHIRIEQDWVRYAKSKIKRPPPRGHSKKSTNNVGIGLVKRPMTSSSPAPLKDDLYLISVSELINLYKKKGFKEDIFFTTGQNQIQVQKQMADMNIRSSYVYIDDLEYEVNAAINFELCCRAKLFIGISRSTFSNLISLRRCLINTNDSYIYNLDNHLCLRVDKGLHPCPIKATRSHVKLM